MPNNVILPTQYSASSLQDFVDCPRRFQLRYMLRVAWPAIETEPVLENEQFIQQGAHFHRLVQQYFCGIDQARLESMIRDEQLEGWWENFLRMCSSCAAFSKGGVLNGRAYSELLLSTPAGGARLAARYDLVLRQPDGSVVIYDWKTSRRRPARGWLAGRLQTRIYPYVFVQAGINGDLAPDRLEMVYWFANFPGDAETIAYSEAQYREDGAYLEGLISRIAGMSGEFRKTDKLERCLGCIYRSLCERGVQAGPVGDAEMERWGEAETGITLDQVDEIAF